MLFNLLKFDLLQQLSRPRFYMATLILLAAVIGLASNQTIHDKLGFSEVNYNAAFLTTTWSYAFSAMSIFILAAFASASIRQDYQYKMIDLIQASGISKFNYLASRYLAGLIACGFLITLIPVGLIIMSNLPILNQELIGELSWLVYAQMLAYILIPNLLIGYSLLFAVAAFTQSNKWVFIVAVSLFILSDGLSEVTAPEDIQVALYFDPQGAVGFWSSVADWTLEQKNAALFNFESSWLVSRLSWFSASLLLLSIGYAKYPFAQLKEHKARKTTRPKKESSPVLPAEASLTASKEIASKDNWQRRIIQSVKISGFEFSQLRAKTALKIALGICLLLTLIPIIESAEQAVVSPHLTSQFLVEHILKILHWPLLLILTIYGTEMVAKETESKVKELAFSLLTYRPALLFGKLFALWLLVITFKLAAILTVSVAHHLILDGDVEFSLYITHVIIQDTPYFMLFAMLVFSVQILTNNEYLAMIISFGIVILSVSLPKLGLNGYFYRFVLPTQADNPQLSLAELSHLKYSLLAYWTLIIGAIFYLSLKVWKSINGHQSLKIFRKRLKASHLNDKRIITR